MPLLWRWTSQESKPISHSSLLPGCSSPCPLYCHQGGRWASRSKEHTDELASLTRSAPGQSSHVLLPPATAPLVIINTIIRLFGRGCSRCSVIGAIEIQHKECGLTPPQATYLCLRPANGEVRTALLSYRIAVAALTKGKL